MSNIKVIFVDGIECVYPHAEASVGGGAVLHSVGSSAYGAETP